MAIQQTSQESVSVAVTELASMQQSIADYEQMHRLLKASLRQNIDYCTLPGSKTAILLKPGAEKLLQFFHLGHRVVCIAKMEDWENGLFFYHYKVVIFKSLNNQECIIAECEGSANSKEKKYRNQDVYNFVNTIQKMAIKRAFVGATVQATGTSGFFS